MAGDEERDRIPRHGGTDGTGGGRVFQRRGQAPVAYQRAGWQLEQGSPHADLEAAATDKGPKSYGGFPAFGHLKGGRQQPGRVGIVTLQECRRPVGLQRRHRRRRVIGPQKTEMADPARALPHQAFSERCVGEAGHKGPPGATRLEFPGRSRLETDAEIMQPSRAGQTRCQRRRQGVFPLAEPPPGLCEREALEEFLGCPPPSGRLPPGGAASWPLRA